MENRCQPQELTEQDHLHMDDFLKAILHDHRNGDLTPDEAVGALAHVMTALAIGNTAEAQVWFRTGRKLARGDRYINDVLVPRGGAEPPERGSASQGRDDEANNTYINDVRVRRDGGTLP